jgi:hypothetical protein
MGDPIQNQISLESRNPTLVKLRNLQSRQIRHGETVVAGRLVVTRACTIRLRNSRDEEIARAIRGVLVTASIFEMMLGPKETLGLEELRAIGSDSLGTIVKGSAARHIRRYQCTLVRVVELHSMALLLDRRKISIERCGAREAVEIAFTWSNDKLDAE